MKNLLVLFLSAYSVVASGQAGLVDPNFNPDDLGHYYGEEFSAIYAPGDQGFLYAAGNHLFTVSAISKFHPNGLIVADYPPVPESLSFQGGEAEEIHHLADGSLLVGGGFTQVGGVNMRRVAHINPDGTLDTGFNAYPGATDAVYSIWPGPNQTVYAGGNFTTYNNEPYARVVRILPDGTHDPSFNPGTGADNLVRSVVMQPDGQLLVGGSFDTFNGVSSPSLVRLNPDGSIDPTLNVGTGFNNNVHKVVLQPDGKILLVGAFTSYNGTPSNRIIRLLPNGTVDPEFDPGSGGSGLMSSASIDAQGRIYTSIGEQAFYNGFVVNQTFRLLSDGTYDSSFSNVMSLTAGVLSDGRILTDYGLKLNEDGSVDTSFNYELHGVQGDVQCITIFPDGRIMAGGQMDTYNGLPVKNIFRAFPGGYVDVSLALTGGPDVNAHAPEFIIPVEDGKALVGGNFNSYNGQPVNRIVRIMPDGSLDPSFHTQTGPNSSVYKAIILPDGKIMISGNFTSIGADPRSKMARLNPDGTLDATFTYGSGPGGSTSVIDFDVDVNGDIIVCGNFTTFHGASRNKIAALNPNGSLKSAFTAANGWTGSWTPKTVQFADGGKVLVAGDMGTLFGSDGYGCIRANSNGTFDTDLMPGVVFDNPQFLFKRKMINGEPKTFLSMVEAVEETVTILTVLPDGTLSDPLLPETTMDNVTDFCFDVDQNMDLVVGGQFSRIANTGRNKIARMVPECPSDPVFGCAFALACNYNPAATCNDGTCLWPGCNNPLACNYNPSAGCDDGTCVDGGKTRITGLVYADFNYNGEYDDFQISIEGPLSNMQVLVEPAGLVLYTDLNGEFSATVPTNTIQTLTVVGNDLFTPHPITGTIVVDTSGNCENPGNELGMISEDDIMVNVSGPCCIWMMDLHCNNGLNPGLMVANTGTVPFSGTVTVSFSEIIQGEPLSGSNVVPPTTINPGEVIWEIDGHPPGTVKLYQCHVTGPGVDYIGQVFPIDLSLNIINETQTEVFDNSWTLTPMVVCAYDPNDKYAVPEGYTEEHHYVPAEDEIEYRIRFQNTGNFPAQYITITDTLDVAHLDLTTFQTHFASHNMQTCLDLNTGVVEFKFMEIWLPDSTTDEPGSQGYLVYHIKPLPGIDPGSVINNTAYIYFEQNPPIVTNTTWHTIVNCEGLADITTGSPALCEGYEASFMANEPYIQSYTWTLDGWPMSFDQTFSFDAIPGAHTIGLQAAHPLCNETGEISFVVNPTVYEEVAEEACAGQTVLLPDGTPVTEDGTFVLNLTSAQTGCDSVLTTTVTFHPVPVAEITVDGIVLTATEGEAWQWFLNGTAIEGATGQSHTADGIGLYTVMVTNDAGCTAISTGILIIGVAESATAEIALFPNPAGTSSTLLLGSGRWDVGVWDLTGKQVLSLANQTDRVLLTATGLSAGTYVIGLRNEAGERAEMQWVVE